MIPQKNYRTLECKQNIFFFLLFCSIWYESFILLVFPVADLEVRQNYREVYYDHVDSLF